MVEAAVAVLVADAVHIHCDFNGHPLEYFDSIKICIATVTFPDESTTLENVTGGGDLDEVDGLHVKDQNLSYFPEETTVCLNT